MNQPVQKLVLFLMLSLFPFTPTLQGQTDSISIPQLALGGGYECVVIVSNRTGSHWRGTGQLRTGDGAEWQGDWAITSSPTVGESSFSIDLGPHATKRMQLTGDDSIRVGYLQITSSPSFAEVDYALAVSFFYNFVKASSLEDSVGVSGGRAGRGFMFPVERMGALNTGFAWAPVVPAAEDSAADPVATSLEMTLHDASGGVLQRRNVPFEGHSAQFFSEVFDEVPDPFLGKVVIEGDGNFALTVIRLEGSRQGFQLTNVPPESYPFRTASSDRILFSQLALGGGYECIVLVSNGSDREWRGRGELRQGMGMPWTDGWKLNGDEPSSSDFSIELGPQETQKFVLAGEKVPQVGYLELKPGETYANNSIAVSFFYNYSSSDNRLLDSVGGPYGEPGNAFSFPVEKTDKADTGVAWAPEFTDTSAESAKIEAQLYDASGTLVETTSLPFEGHGSKFISEIFDNVRNDFLGSVHFKGDTSFFLTILRLENNGSGFQLTSSPPVSEGVGEFGWIGPSGGIVSDRQGAAVRVPAGALDEELSLRVNTINDLNTPTGLNGPLAQVLGAASFGPSGLYFDEPVVVTIPLANPAAPGDSVPIYQYYPEDGAWAQTKFVGKVNGDGRSVDVSVTHFSVLAILGSSLEYMDLFGDFPSRWYEGDLLGQYRETVFRVNEMFSVGHKEPYEFPPREYKCYEIVATTFVLDHNDPSLTTPLYDVYGTPPFDAPPCLQKKCFVDKYGPLLIVLRYEDSYSIKQGDEEITKAVQFDINIWLDCAVPELNLYPPETPLKAGEEYEVGVCLECGLQHLDRHEVSFQAVNGKIAPEQLTTPKQCSTVTLIPTAGNCEDGEVLFQAEHFACAHERREENLIEEKRLPFEFDISGSWQWSEVADETGCGEGVNTYTTTASITVYGSSVVFAVPGVNASATKNGCIISGFGSEQEDQGISYGSGTLTIDPDGKKIHGTASWTWYGDGESCSGTSKITATRN